LQLATKTFNYNKFDLISNKCSILPNFTCSECETQLDTMAQLFIIQKYYAKLSKIIISGENLN